ncbi:trimethylguanosine synthase-like [Panonychus citri]|uniref:trimethylguanosine synthase-like n=1 Tax=Panonychus citri TaxID=50023 RepID=UPI002307960A|nr:trimethylguanosine synthase-like [Panonychus citri]
MSESLSNSECEVNEIEIIRDEISDLEKQLMETLGLPSSFSTTKRDFKSKEEKKEESKRQKKEKKKKSNKNLCKYWAQRYRLFSRFDDGIQMDSESWYSVTPELIGNHIACKCVRDGEKSMVIIMDPFCGVGGNVIQFALKSPNVFVIASDIDGNKVRMAKHNSCIYGVDNQIAFLVGDYFQILSTIKLPVDCIFLSPPWGGPNYLSQKVYSLSNMRPNGFEIFAAAKEHVSCNIAFLLPRNIDRDEINSLLQPNESVEIEQNLINNKPKTITAYFGNLVDQTNSS